MKQNKAKQFYQSQVEKLRLQMAKLGKKLRFLSIARGTSFISAILFFILFYKFNLLPWAIGSTIFFILLLIFLVQKYFFVEKNLKFLQQLKNINEQELRALEFDFSSFETGDKFINPNHDFSFDMDLFGEKSVFQMINRAQTIAGKNKLASYFQELLYSKDEIAKRNKSVAELSQMPLWNQNFLAIARQSSLESRKSNFSFMQFGSKSKTADEEFNSFRIEKFELNTLFWKSVLIILPLISIFLLSLSIFGDFPSILYFFYALFMLSVVGSKLKYINAVHNKLGQQNKILNRYSELLFQLESTDFNSEFINGLKERHNYSGKSASKALNALAKNLKALDNRLNFVFAILSNALLLWDMQLVKRIEEWQKKYADDFSIWIDSISEMEYLISLATFKYNNSNYVFPTFSEKTTFKAEALGHPILPNNKCITNDFEMANEAKTFIITGANMAGKSTFLRTLGVNLILAQMGSVVFAKSFIFSPIHLITSIKISDSLKDNESYFYAELKRLQYIVENSNKEFPLFIIIDEMLRGTNSGDKHKGSEGLLRKLTSGNNINFLATHDIALGKLEEEFPGLVKNYCFEAEIKKAELFFDYKLRRGISKNLNATFLMKKMKIID